MSFSQTHGGFTEATARSATAQKWCSPKRSAGTLPATVSPLLSLSGVLATVFFIALNYELIISLYLHFVKTEIISKNKK